MNNGVTLMYTDMIHMMAIAFLGGIWIGCQLALFIAMMDWHRKEK